MKKIKLQLTEFCLKCRCVQNISGTTATRVEEDSNEAKKLIITVSYYCEACNTFIRSEEHEIKEKNSVAA